MTMRKGLSQLIISSALLSHAASLPAAEAVTSADERAKRSYQALFMPIGFAHHPGAGIKAAMIYRPHLLFEAGFASYRSNPNGNSEHAYTMLTGGGEGFPGQFFQCQRWPGTAQLPPQLR